MKRRIKACAILLAISGVAFTAVADEPATLETNEKEITGFKQQSWEQWRETFHLNTGGHYGSLANDVIADESMSDSDKWLRLFDLSRQQYAYDKCGTGKECESLYSQYESQIEQHPGQGEGMGLMAQKLGYKPGSKEFNDLKQVIQTGDQDALNRLFADSSLNDEMNEKAKASKVAKKEKAIEQGKLTGKEKVAQNKSKGDNGNKGKGKKDKNKS